MKQHFFTSRPSELIAEAPKIVSYDAKKISSAPTTELNVIYQKVYDFFNRELFDGKLPPVYLRLNSRVRAKGYYVPCAWMYGTTGRLPEISINPVMLTKPPVEMWSTLVHEMVHHFQFLFGNPGTGGYHNREFSKLMFRVGLICSSTGELGGRQTGRNMTHYIDRDGLFIKKWRNMPKEYSLLLKPLGLGTSPISGIAPVKLETRKNNANIAAVNVVWLYGGNQHSMSFVATATSNYLKNKRNGNYSHLCARILAVIQKYLRYREAV